MASVEEVNSVVSNACCDHEHHGHEHHAHGAGGEDVDSHSSIGRSRNERKARKALAKLGLKRVEGITRVTFCRTKTMVFVIQNAEVYKHPHSNTYVIFGEPKAEDLGLAAQAQAARNLKAATAGKNPAEIEAHLKEYAESLNKGGLVTNQSTEAEDEDADIDETGLDEKDIVMLMEQANVSRKKAVKTLKENDGDIVNSIMALSG